MKKYLIFSTLSFTLISFLIELMMSSNPGFSTFKGFNWLLSSSLFSSINIITWGIEGLAISFAAYLYIQAKSALVDGFRFGLITGLLFIMLLLFNMMIQVDHSIYPFLAESLLPLVALQLLGFVLSGWLFGLMFEVFSPKSTHVNSMWTIA